MYVDPFSSSCMDSGQGLPSGSCHHTQSLLGGGFSGYSCPSFPETSFHSHPTPVNATQVTNVGTSQVANSLTAFIPATSTIPHTVASFTPGGSTASFGHLTTNYASGRTSQIGAEIVVSSGLIYQLNLRPQSTMANQGTLPAVISSHPFQLKFLTTSIKVCAGCRGGYVRGSPPEDLCLIRKEQHLYYNVVNGRQQYSSLSNVHYHANTNCPRLRCPDFNPNTVEIPDSVRDKLLPEHFNRLFVTVSVA